MDVQTYAAINPMLLLMAREAETVADELELAPLFDEADSQSRDALYFSQSSLNTSKE